MYKKFRIFVKNNNKKQLELIFIYFTLFFPLYVALTSYLREREKKT